MSDSMWNKGIIEGLKIARAFTNKEAKIALTYGRNGRAEALANILIEINDAIETEQNNIRLIEKQHS